MCKDDRVVGIGGNMTKKEFLERMNYLRELLTIFPDSKGELINLISITRKELPPAGFTSELERGDVVFYIPTSLGSTITRGSALLDVGPLKVRYVHRDNSWYVHPIEYGWGATVKDRGLLYKFTESMGFSMEL